VLARWAGGLGEVGQRGGGRWDEASELVRKSACKEMGKWYYDSGGLSRTSQPFRVSLGSRAGSPRALQVPPPHLEGPTPRAGSSSRAAAARKHNPPSIMAP